MGSNIPITGEVDVNKSESETSSGRRWGLWEKLTLTVITPMLVANIAVLSWACTKINDLDGRMARVESQIFTPEQRSQLVQDLAVLSAAVQRLTGDQPPAWFLRRFDQMEVTTIRRLDGIDVKIDKLADKVGAHLEKEGDKP